MTPEALRAAELDRSGKVANRIAVCHVLEARYDLFPQREWADLCRRIFLIHPKAIILGTFRLVSDGGNIPDVQTDERLEWWDQVLSGSITPNWIDVEWSVAQAWERVWRSWNARGIKVLASMHDFSKVPSWDELELRVRTIRNLGMQGFKVAAFAREISDCAALYRLASHYGGEFEWFAAFAMGDVGKISRVFSLACGANLTYGAVDRAVAPGQIEADLLAELIEQLPALRSEHDVIRALAIQGGMV